ncbi:MAG: ABC transporter ATP-binding protein [Planctomycetes bacterium]|nr:ABC transporter ATP-binding protein [Planctomycetota bacterium]
MAQTSEIPARTKAAVGAPVVEFTDVHTKLGGRQILDGLTFDVRKGETFVIIGYSGTGKSVTLRHLVGLMQPDAGSIRVENEEITTMSGRELADMRRKFGVLFQSGALIAWLTVFENVELPLLEHSRHSRKRRAEIIEEKLKLVNLWPDKDKYPAEISGGMKKRAGLARAIALDAQIVLYDEPSSGLDPVIANEVDKLINSLRDKLGVTSIVVTHDMESAYFIADRIGMFYKGRMIQIGTPDEIRNSTIPEVRHFITGGKEGALSMRSHAAIGTGRAPGMEHPSMRVEPPAAPQTSSGDTTIMQGFVLLDEIPPERSRAEQTTAHGISGDAKVRGTQPVEDGEKTRLGVASDATVRGAQPVNARDLEEVTPNAPTTLSGRQVVTEEDDDEIVDLSKTEEDTQSRTASGRYVMDEEEPEQEDSSIAVPADKTAIEPLALEPEPAPKPVVQDLSPEQPEELK